jgi:hypothetical protein
MARAFPADLQAGDGSANALAGGRDPLRLLQVALQQRGRPGRGAVAVISWIAVDDRVNQRIDNSQGRRGASSAGGVEQAVGHAEVGPTPERLDPVVDGLAAHQEEVSDRCGRPPVMEPQQALGAPQLRGVMRSTHELHQATPLPRSELEGDHKPPPAGGRCKGRSLCQRTSVLLLSWYRFLSLCGHARREGLPSLRTGLSFPGCGRGVPCFAERVRAGSGPGQLSAFDDQLCVADRPAVKPALEDLAGAGGVPCPSRDRRPRHVRGHGVVGHRPPGVALLRRVRKPDVRVPGELPALQRPDDRVPVAQLNGTSLDVNSFTETSYASLVILLLAGQRCRSC